MLVIDQAEEIFTLARPDADGPARLARSLRMLARLGSCPGDFKVIVALRTEFYGRMVAVLRRALDGARAVREDFLAELGRNELVDFVTRPTLDHPIAHSAEVPRARYGFFYAPGVAESVADQELGAGRRDGVLPLAQVVCGQHWERAIAREPDPATGLRFLVTAADLDSLGGFDGMPRARAIVDRQVQAVVPAQPAARAWFLWPVQGLRPERSWTRAAFRRLMTDLTLSQADGAQTTALLAERDLRTRYGRLVGLPFDALLDRAVASRLLRASVRRNDAGCEERSLSLGHDALTRVTAPWKQEIERRAERRRWRTVAGLATLVGVLSLAFAGLWVAVVRQDHARQAAKARISRAVPLLTAAAREGWRPPRCHPDPRSGQGQARPGGGRSRS